jgi:hypothetical protein
MCLSYIAQVNHPLEIEFRNTVLLFKVSARRISCFFSNFIIFFIKRKIRKEGYTPPMYSFLSYGVAISSLMTSARRLIPSRITSSSEYEKFSLMEL